MSTDYCSSVNLQRVGLLTSRLCWPVLNLSEAELRSAPHCRTLKPALALLCYFPSFILLSESSENIHFYHCNVVSSCPSHFLSKPNVRFGSLLNDHDETTYECSVWRSGCSLWYCLFYHSSVLSLACSQIFIFNN